MKRIVIIILIIGIAFLGILYFSKSKNGKIVQGEGFEAAAGGLLQEISAHAASNDVDILVDEKSLMNFDYSVHIDDSLNVYGDERFLEDIMGCSVIVYKNGSAVVERGEEKFAFPSNELISTEDHVYIPLTDYARRLGYDMEYIFSRNAVDFHNIDGGKFLPKVYDMRDDGRVTPVRDQGKLGTCWAFASLGALETVTMPQEENVYSVDHMSMNNGFSLDLSEGGEHTMAIAYLAAWKGPVMEDQDPYGDGETRTGLRAQKHLEEAIILDDHDDEKIKTAIWKYGGVETSIYMEMTYGEETSKYYNTDTASYYYDGDSQPNHDLIIVGWDDTYPKERFTIHPSKDGAYICKNSWGTEFGDKGYIYISYEDANICNQAIVYSKVADDDNYENIYQTDLLGWVGQIGYGEEKSYFANVYTAKSDELLKAVSFYATGPDTKFSVYIVDEFTDKKSLLDRKLIGKGETRYAGYYTVNLDRQIELSKGQKFAVVVYIETPGTEKPIAIECDGGERTKDLDLTDGEGYISLWGEVWYRAEENDCNVCLKVFTDDK